MMRLARVSLAWLLMAPAAVLMAIALIIVFVGAVIDWMGERLCAAINKLDPSMHASIRRLISSW